MENVSTTTRYPFLQGGGEMGERTRAYDWSTTSLGSPEQWPQSLRTALSILLHSKFPMFLFWGSDLLCFYNDAYRPSLGNEGKHPNALGKPGDEVWPEIWPVIKPLIDQVLSGGEATWSEDQLLPIYRNGTLEDVYWTFSYSPVSDETGRPAGVFVTCTETTGKVITFNKLQLSEQRFQNLVREASVGIIVLGGEDMRVEVVNDAYARLIDRPADELQGQPLFGIIPEAETAFRPFLDDVRRTGEPLYFYGQPYWVYNANQVRINGFLDLVYQPYREQDGTVTGVMVLCQDVTEQKKAEEALRASEERFRSLIEEAPVATMLMTGPSHVIELANDSMIAMLGKGKSILGKPAVEAVPELADQTYPRLLDHVYTSGETYQAKALPGQLVNDDATTQHYFDFTYKPMRKENGDIYGIMSMAVDVTHQVVAGQKLAESEAKLRSVVETAPVAIGLFMGRDLVIELPNQTFIDIVGKGPDIVGKPLREVMPELLTENQPFLQILDDVFTSGRQFHSYGSQVQIVRQGVMTHNYYNITYTPLFNETGAVYAILDIAVDVTGQVLARQRLEAAEATLRGAIELAELGTWELDVASGTVTYSDRIKAWFGFADGTVDQGAAYNSIHKKDRDRIQTAILRALEPDSSGIYDEEYTLVDQRTGHERMIHAQGITFFDAQGKPLKITGTAQDVTEQRQLQLTLEQQVRERTEALTASNQAFEEANSLLLRSNENLQRFAYVASHDLQEPLRKIISFGDRLKSRYSTELGDGSDYVERMQAAANRMSTLISDLLTFSRISTNKETTTAVALTQVVNEVLTDLELLIQETGAVVRSEPLPTVQGDKMQLGQLFQNLLNNALKFRRPDLPLTIALRTQVVKATELPDSVKPTRHASSFYRIDVADNGIGFEQKYVDRIFEVFQRLHGRSEYTGTGIGLAICEKVAANHGGTITASSQPGQGATFSVYFPV